MKSNWIRRVGRRRGDDSLEHVGGLAEVAIHIERPSQPIGRARLPDSVTERLRYIDSLARGRNAPSGVTHLPTYPAHVPEYRRQGTRIVQSAGERLSPAQQGDTPLILPQIGHNISQGPAKVDHQ